MERGDTPFLIAGGGIGGLVCALALAGQGLYSRVLEQAPEFTEIGAGIQLGPNLVRAIDRIGLKDEVLSDAWFPENLVLRDAVDGSEVTCIPAGDGLRNRFGQPYALTHRADLLAVLVAACRESRHIQLLTDHRVVRIADRDDHVTVEFEDKPAMTGVGLVGADGLWSRVREHVIGDGQPIPVGAIAYRAVVPASEVPVELWSPDMTVWGGQHTHLVHYPLRRGTLYNLVAVFDSDRYTEGYDEVGDPDELWRHFRDDHASVRALLERIDTWKYWVLCDRDARRGWTKGRVTLLGDAAHPTLQYLAQGAAMAVEDAVCLAHELAKADGDPAVAFARYEDRRVLRTGRAQIMARVYGDVIHAANVARELRKQWLAARTPEQSWNGMAWLYEYDPVAEQPRVESGAGQA